MSGTRKTKIKAEEVKNPNDLRRYLHVTNMSSWLILLAVAILLVAGIMYSMMAWLEVTRSVAVVVENGEAIGALSADELDEISAGMTIRIDDTQGVVTQVSTHLSVVDEDFNSYLLYLTDHVEGDGYYEMQAYIDVPDGTYEAQIVVEEVQPINLLFSS